MTSSLNRAMCVCVLAGSVVSGCGSAGDTAYGQSAAASTSDWPWSSTCDASVGTCSNGAATVTLSGTLTTTRGLSPISVTVSVNGGPSEDLGTISATDFTHGGPTKTADYSFDLTLTNGSYSLNVCFAQAGGGPAGHTMCDQVSVTVNCDPDPCSGVEFFGNIVSNPNVGGSNTHSVLPIHVRGDLGDSPLITAQGPDTTESGLMRHAGDSCNYQYVFPRSTAGLYLFTVQGNGHTYTFNATAP